MTTVKERIETGGPDNTKWNLLTEWAYGNLIPADDSKALIRALNEQCDNGSVDGQIRALFRVNALRHGYVPADEVDARIAEAMAARDAEWRGAFRSNGLTERAVELFGPRGPEEARTFIEEGEKFAVEMERERCARIAEGPQAINTPMGNPVGEIRRMIAAAIRGDDHDG